MFFAFSFAAKITSVFGIVTAVIWLFARGRRRSAVLLGLFWMIGIAILAIATQAASHGRAIAIFRETASGGGGVTTVLLGPRRFFFAILNGDHISVAFWIVGLALVLWNRNWKELPAILFLVTTVGTMLVLGSPGTGINHLMGLQAASILVVGMCIVRFPSERFAVTAATCVLVALGIRSCWQQTAEIAQDPERHNLAEIVSDIRQSGLSGPIYANNPLIPIFANQRPYLLDAFMAHLMRQRDPRTGEKLWDDLDHARFSACVIHVHPTEYGAEWTNDDKMVMAHLSKYYLKATYGPDEVYLPKAR